MAWRRPYQSNRLHHLLLVLRHINTLHTLALIVPDVILIAMSGSGSVEVGLGLGACSITQVKVIPWIFAEGQLSPVPEKLPSIIEDINQITSRVVGNRNRIF